MPPLTPGTNKKLTEVLNASFASWEKEVQFHKITKGKISYLFIYNFLYSVLTKVFLLILIKKYQLKQTHTHASIIYNKKVILFTNIFE